MRVSRVVEVTWVNEKVTRVGVIVHVDARKFIVDHMEMQKNQLHPRCKKLQWQRDVIPFVALESNLVTVYQA